MDTIFAVSSGRPPAAIAVLRVSGPLAIAGIGTLAGRMPRPRQAVLRQLRDAGGGGLDQALVIVFPGPNSATGEDLVELHCHGGRAVVAAVEAALSRLSGFRPAHPGEFTRRALTNGRIDLAEAEGVADLLQADTESQRIAALSAVEGRVSRIVGEWIGRIAMMSARLEAELDFADEDDVGDGPETVRDIVREMRVLADDMTTVLAVPSVDRLRDGIRVVLAGPPNSGKSTLLNLLSEREAAIVSPIAGTTRDRVEIAVSRHGLPFVLTDTAGLAGHSDDPIELIGIGRAKDAMATADILVWMADTPPDRNDAIWIHSRADLPERSDMPPDRMLAVRSDAPASIEALWKAVIIRSRQLVPRSDQLALADRQRRLCYEATESLRQAWSDPLVGAELLRRAHAPLATLLGRNATESMLDALFGRFCIGK